MTEQIILIKKTIFVLSEYEESIKINLLVKTINSNKYILEIFDSEGRHFTSSRNDYIDQAQLRLLYEKDFDICFQYEYNFMERKNDIWIEIYPQNQIYILNQEFDEYCLVTIENKIQTITQELELLKERNNLLKKTYYPDTRDEFNSDI